MSAPLLLLLITGILAISVALLRDRPRSSATTAAIGSAIIAAFALLVALDEPLVVMRIPIKFAGEWRVLGRLLILNEANRAPVGFLYIAGSFLFAGAWITKPARTIYYIGLLCLAAVASSLMIQPFLFAAIFLEFAAMGAVLILVSPQNPARAGGLRLLILYSLAMMAILLAGWMLENVGVTVATPELANRATLLLAFGFAVLMAVPPFHLWLPTTAGSTNPFSLAFVIVILQSAGLFFLFRFLDSYTWLRSLPGLFDLIRVVGIAMLWFGGLSVLGQRSFSKLMAYALLTDFGVTLLAVGTGTPEGYRLALGLSGVRVVSLAVWALGLACVIKDVGEDQIHSLQGVAHRVPLAATASLIGVVSVAGFPLTAGFPGRWALLSHLAMLHPAAGWSILFGSLCVGAAALRWANRMLIEPTQEDRFPRSFSERFFLGGGIILCLAMGVFPQILYPWVVEAVAGMTQLIP